MKTAILLGATGLVGSQLLKLLLDDPGFSKVKIFTRRSTGIKHPGLEEHIVDFDIMENWAGNINGDVLFSAFGTTLKKAGSKAAQYKIDYHYQFQVARIAAENDVKDCILVSSPGASPKSKVFYTRMKGELDRDMAKLGFARFRIIQPSILSGSRNDSRFGEKAGIYVMNALSWIPGIRKYRPVSGEKVAKAMIMAYEDELSLPIVIYGLEQLHQMAEKHRS